MPAPLTRSVHREALSISEEAKARRKLAWQRNGESQKDGDQLRDIN